MTQNASDVEIDNQGFAAFRQDLNDVLEDITTLHSGTAAPSTTYANQWWYETDTDKLYIRNEDNDAWIEILTLDQANDKLASLGVILHIDDTGSTKQLEIQAPNTVNNHTQLRFNSQYYQYWDITNDAGELKFGRGGTDYVTIDSSGNTGIGTDTALLTNSTRGNLTINGSGSSILTFGVGDAYKGYVFADSQKLELDAGGSGRYMQFNTDGNERMRIQPGGGISFNGDTAAANALDDYEEGTWTPTVSYGAISVIRALYTKIGRAVTVTATVQRTTATASANTLTFTGLPFQTSVNGEWIGTAMNNSADLQTTGIVSYMYGLNSTDEILIYSNRDNASPLSMKHNEFGLNDYLYFTITYFT